MITVTATPVMPTMVELNLNTVYKIVYDALTEVYGITEDMEIAGDNLRLTQPAYERSVGTQMRVIRKATPRDAEGVSALKNLREWYRRKQEETRGNDVS